MDDYDADYKELGIDMFRYIFIDNMAAADVRMSGLGLLVWKVKKKKRSFLSLV